VKPIGNGNVKGNWRWGGK